MPPDRSMNDRRTLHRYLTLVRHAEDLLREPPHGPALAGAAASDALPLDGTATDIATAEAVATLEALLDELDPVIREMPAANHQPRAQDIAEIVAGWVY